MIISFCLDRPILELVRWANIYGLSGDLRRTLESLKEFGQPFAIVIACLLIFVLDKPRRAMLTRLVICIVLPSLLVWPAKVVVHRLRPLAASNAETVFGLGFFLGATPELPTFIREGVAGKETIQEHRPATTSEKRSFPSAHTATAFAFAVGLAVLYPPARWIFYALAIGCGAHRLIFDAHWFSDVIASVFIGLLVARAVWIRSKA